MFVAVLKDAELFGRVVSTLKHFLRVVELEVSQKGISVLTMDVSQVIVVHGTLSLLCWF